MSGEIEQYRKLVEQLTENKAQEAGIKSSKAFENLVSSLVMAPYDLSVDEIEAGDTDGGGDGQIDALYVLVNGHSLNDEDVENNLIPSKGPLEVDIVFIQSKYVDSFEENTIRSIRNTIMDLFDLNKDYDIVGGSSYSSILMERFNLARYAIMATSGRPSTIRARIIYATKGDNKNLHGSVRQAGNTLQTELRNAATTSNAEVSFLSASDIIEMSRKPSTSMRTLTIAEQISHDGDSFACLASIESLMAFLTDENGNLVRSLFDANVRDFLGTTDVNDAIFETLQTLGEEDFWWFNNGITLVADKIDPKGKKLTVVDPLLVNGLQTSNVIYSFMSDSAVDESLKAVAKTKHILIRIIKPTSSGVRDTIIKATNSQTNIPKPYLRGMDQIHRNIEDHLKQSGLYYERRKNQYKNEGKARASIVTLTEMAQALVSALLFRGGDARGRPTSLLKLDNEYQTLFSEKYSLDVYKVIIEAKRRISVELISQYSTRGSAFRNDVMWHILSYISASHFYSTLHAAQKWHELKLIDAEITSSIQEVVNWYDESGGTDKVAKSTTFQTLIRSNADAARKAKTVLELANSTVNKIEADASVDMI